jgi:hypothetical protein
MKNFCVQTISSDERILVMRFFLCFSWKEKKGEKDDEKD